MGYPRTINNLYKFDADCFEPVVLSNGKKFFSSNTGKMTYKMKKEKKLREQS